MSRHDWQPIAKGDRSRLARSSAHRRCARCGVLRRRRGVGFESTHAYYAPSGRFVALRPPPCRSEAEQLEAVRDALERMPKDAQFRALAYLVARAADVGTCSATEWLYELARAEQAKGASSS